MCIALGAVALIVAGSLAATRRSAPSAERSLTYGPNAAAKVAEKQLLRRVVSLPRATRSLYEHSVRPTTLRQQGCRAAKNGVSGIVILDFGQPAYDGHSYGANLFSGRFAGNRAITRALLAYGHGYVYCLRPGSRAHITLARGTNNFHPQVPSAYRAGWKWARQTRVLGDLLRQAKLHEHVSSAAADDVEPAWDRSFHKTRDFFRGYADSRMGKLLYNYGSLDGGVGAIWNARQAFYVASGMRYSRALPEIYTHEMARQWARLAVVAERRYHRPIRFAGVLSSPAGGFLKPREAHRALVRALASNMAAAPAVPPTITTINWS